VDAGLIVIVAFISPFRAERQLARGLFEDGEFVEVFVDTPIEECERRDVKGLYANARRGELKNFTGIDSAYEPPLSGSPPPNREHETRGLRGADRREFISSQSSSSLVRLATPFSLIANRSVTPHGLN
jgi:hypothetical protein